MSAPRARAVHASAQPYTFASMAIAVTAADLDLLRPFTPFVGLKRLRPRGIIIWATTLGRVACGVRKFGSASRSADFSAGKLCSARFAIISAVLDQALGGAPGQAHLMGEEPIARHGAFD